MRLIEKLKAFWRGNVDTIAGNNAFDMPKRTRILVAIGFVILCALGDLWLGTMLKDIAASDPAEGSPAWDAVLATRVAAARQWWVLKAIAVTLSGGYLVFALFDRTPLGKRLWHWSFEQDTEGTAAAKTLSATVGFVGILVVLAILTSRMLP